MNTDTEMQQFIGTKVINAKPMTRLEYNQFRGWDLPSNENGEDAGFLVEYVDGGSANTKEYSGYVSWSPQDVFNKSYESISLMSFSHCLEFLKQGLRLRRAGWNGKGMYVELSNSMDYQSSDLLPFFVIKNTSDSFNTWVPSVSDVLANDWQLVMTGVN